MSLSFYSRFLIVSLVVVQMNAASTQESIYTRGKERFSNFLTSCGNAGNSLYLSSKGVYTRLTPYSLPILACSGAAVVAGTMWINNAVSAKYQVSNAIYYQAGKGVEVLFVGSIFSEAYQEEIPQRIALGILNWNELLAFINDYCQKDYRVYLVINPLSETVRVWIVDDSGDLENHLMWPFIPHQASVFAATVADVKSYNNMRVASFLSIGAGALVAGYATTVYLFKKMMPVINPLVSKFSTKIKNLYKTHQGTTVTSQSVVVAESAAVATESASANSADQKEGVALSVADSRQTESSDVVAAHNNEAVSVTQNDLEKNGAEKAFEKFAWASDLAGN